MGMNTQAARKAKQKRAPKENIQSSGFLHALRRVQSRERGFSSAWDYMVRE